MIESGATRSLSFVKTFFMKGYIEVYTGDGKGKTTAAIGLAVRAVGAGKKVCFIQFMKSMAYSEQKILQQLPGLKLITLGKPYFIAKEGMLTEEEIKAWGSALRVYPAGHPPKEYRDMVLKGIEDAVKAVSKDYDLVVLDEYNMAPCDRGGYEAHSRRQKPGLRTRLHGKKCAEDHS